MAEPEDPPRRDRRLRYPFLWLLFVATMLSGAGLVSSRSVGLRNLGLVLLVLPLLVLGGLALAYYVVERLRAQA